LSQLIAVRILILGSTSFAAQGLPELLERNGHKVWTFNRTAVSDGAVSKALFGDYSRIAEIIAPMGDCDALINFAIVKFGSVEDNRVLLANIVKAADALRVRRFIHISSISVLPSNRGVVDESSPAVDQRWKGAYSRVKADAEQFLTQEWRSSPLLIVRPGFILGEGVVDPIVGIAMRLPMGFLLGLGNQRTVIPLVSRETVHDALAQLVKVPLEELKLRTFMLVSPTAPTRREYLDFHCRQFGRGTQIIHFPAWLWRWGLIAASFPLSIFNRRRFRLAKLFEHNLSVRHYNCDATSMVLHLDLNFDWREYMRKVQRILPGLRWPESTSREKVRLPRAERLLYVGLGRIAQQKHLPALARVGFRGVVTAIDSAIAKAPDSHGFSIELARDVPQDCARAVITAPWFAREQIFKNLPQTVQQVLLEKPLAVSGVHLEQTRNLIAGRNIWVMHNYRRKANVVALRQFLQKYPSGALRHVSVRFETPSPFIEKSAWMRREKEHRILIADYAMHFLDVAWLFFDGAMKIGRLEIIDNARRELESLSADLSFPNGNCTLMIRQGCHRREAHVHYCFQNYDAHLRFFPDVFAVTLGGHSAWDDLRLAAGATKGIAVKLADKLGWAVADRSHDDVLAAFAGLPGGCDLNEFSAQNLLPFYQHLTQLADAAYA
jgi:nucleoside-diphosphate-sugar epimerase/predicted dehydrogenase